MVQFIMINQKLYVLLLAFLSISSVYATPLYFCTGASSNYFPHVLNLIGSIHRVNFDDLGEIAVYDLGLSQHERDALSRIQKVSVQSLQCTHPQLLQFFTLPNGHRILGWYAWKPVAIKQALDLFPYVLWIDAGSTVLKPLNTLMQYIEQEGYFIATIGNEYEHGRYRHPISWGTTHFVRKKFDLDKPDNRWILSAEFVMGNIIGVARESKDLFLMSLYEMTKDLRNYQDDGSTPNGFGTARHDQTLLSVWVYLHGLTVFKQDYTQQVPMMLSVKGHEEPLYITWNKPYVCEKTCIYSSRGDLSYNGAQYIHYKN